MAHINVPNTHKKIYIKHEKESFHADVYEKFRDDKKIPTAERQERLLTKY